MKKTFFLIFVLALMANVGNAQFFVGGNVSVVTNNSSFEAPYHDKSNTSNVSVGIAPKLGYILSDKLWVGMEFEIDYSEEVQSGLSNNKTGYAISPFVRYYAMRFNKFALCLQGQVGVGFGTIYLDNDNPKVDLFGFRALVSPIVTYDMNDKFTFEAQINGLNIAYDYTSQKQDEATNTSSNFNFGLNTGSLFTTGAITVGVVFKL